MRIPRGRSVQVMWRQWRQSRIQREIRRRATDELVRSLGLILEPTALRASITSRLRELVECTAVRFCVVTQGDDAFVEPADTAENGVPRLQFDAGGTLARWLRINETALVIPHPSGAFDYLDPSERETLSAAGARVCMPVFAGPDLIGVLLFCATEAWRLSPEDLALVERVAAQAGFALRNADLQRMERDRLQNVYRAEQLAVAGQLAATVAHEIRNPLTAIRSTVQFVLTDARNWEQTSRLLQGIVEAVDRIDQTIGAVLTLTRADTSGFIDIDLVASVEDALLLSEPYARAHGIVVERQFEVISLPVTADRRGIQQVCMNLFFNACQAMPDGGRLVFRCAVGAMAGPPQAVLQVRDTGRGISPEQITKVFEPFFTTKPGGTGLGLPICRDIVTRHGGQLRLESEPDRGTTATVILPLRGT